MAEDSKHVPHADTSERIEASEDTASEEFVVEQANAPGPMDPAEDTALEALIVEAFRVAAKRGAPIWYQMHGTVLKNRLLGKLYWWLRVS